MSIVTNIYFAVFLEIIKTKAMFMITRYIGKASSEKVHIFITAKPEKIPKRPVRYGVSVSVHGSFQDFIKVGIAAKKSLMIEKIIASSACLVNHHKIKAKTEKAPQK